MMDVLSDTRRILIQIRNLARQRVNTGVSLHALLYDIAELAEQQASNIETFQLMQKAPTNDSDKD